MPTCVIRRREIGSGSIRHARSRARKGSTEKFDSSTGTRSPTKNVAGCPSCGAQQNAPAVLHQRKHLGKIRGRPRNRGEKCALASAQGHHRRKQRPQRLAGPEPSNEVIWLVDSPESDEGWPNNCRDHAHQSLQSIAAPPEFPASSAKRSGSICGGVIPSWRAALRSTSRTSISRISPPVGFCRSSIRSPATATACGEARKVIVRELVSRFDARDAGDIAHHAQRFRHLLGSFRSGQQDAAHHRRLVIPPLLRRVLAHEKERGASGRQNVPVMSPSRRIAVGKSTSFT